MKGKFIVCEGLDRAGKTTSIKEALKLLHEDSSSFCYCKGMCSNSYLGKKNRKNPTTDGFFLEQADIDRTFIIPQIVQGYNILRDRWFYSILSHHELTEEERRMENLIVPELTKPDLLIHFTVSLEERITRLRWEGWKKDSRMMIDNPSIIIERERRYMKFYENFQGPKAVINTTGKTAKESGQVLYSIINQYLQINIFKFLNTYKQNYLIQTYDCR